MTTVGLWSASRRCSTLQTAGVRAALIRRFERFGVPAAMLMDHGAPWWSTQGPAGLTRLVVFLLKQGIRVVFSAVRHPQTQGKVERFHRTLAERLRWSASRRRWRAFRQTLAWFREESTRCDRLPDTRWCFMFGDGVT